jgi:polyisoprenoid-binding protein YceI
LFATRHKEVTVKTLVKPIPGYLVGTWSIDSVHSYVGFVIPHSMIAKVRGQFESVYGQIVTAEEILESRVDVIIDAASFHTNSAVRNQHIQSADFLDVAHYPSLTFSSTGIRLDDGFWIEGDLTIHGVTKPVVLRTETPKFGENHAGTVSIGVSAATTIRRSDFGVDFNMPIAGGGFLLGDTVDVVLEIEANLQQ